VVASLVDVVLTVEFKIHFLKPAKTDRVIAVGQVVQAGRTPTVCEGSVFDATRTRVLARMTTTTSTLIDCTSRPSLPTSLALLSSTPTSRTSIWGWSMEPWPQLLNVVKSTES
jgi:hypothetical protein